MAVTSTVNILQESELTENFNFMKPTDFHVRIDRKRFHNLQFFANTVTHPGVSVSTPSLAIPRLQNMSVPGDTYAVDEVSMDILLDEDMKCYIEMYNWLNTTVQRNYEPHHERVGDAYIPESDIVVSILSSHNNVLKKIKYINCVPTSLGNVTLQSTVSDDPPLVFPVTFRMSYFEII
jgi:hypothetical protein|tara:strand:+ start:84 stop:617 length:534 start_codon:yes stop_codon:yes gene_type:complete